MKLKKRIEKTVLKFIPSKYKEQVATLLIYSGIDETSDEYLGPRFFKISTFFILTFALLMFIKIAAHFKLLILLGILIFPTFMIMLLLYFKAEARKNLVEHNLPDVLQLMSANMQAGMTPFDAIKSAAEKNIGPLGKSLKEATTKALGSYKFSDELINIGNKYNSTILKRSLRLISSSLSSGSKLANLLDDLSEDISQTDSLKKEMITNTKTYTMFIMFTIICGTPLLLAISIHFVDMVADIQSSTDLSSNEFGISFMAGELAITSEFLTILSYVILVVTAFLASMLTGMITHGKTKSGLKLAPIIAGASIVVFLISRVAIQSMF